MPTWRIDKHDVQAAFWKWTCESDQLYIRCEKEMIRKLIGVLLLVAASIVVVADPRILPMRECAAVIDRWLTTRVQTVLPELMRRAGVANRWSGRGLRRNRR